VYEHSGALEEERAQGVNGLEGEERPPFLLAQAPLSRVCGRNRSESASSP
jgi:hypothetical protein